MSQHFGVSVVLFFTLLSIVCAAEHWSYCSDYCRTNGHWQRGFGCYNPQSPVFCCGNFTERYCCADPSKNVGTIPSVYNCPKSSWWMLHWQILVGTLVGLLLVCLIAACCYYTCGQLESGSGPLGRLRRRRDPGLSTVETEFQNLPPPPLDPVTGQPINIMPPAYDSLPKEPPSYDEIMGIVAAIDRANPPVPNTLEPNTNASSPSQTQSTNSTSNNTSSTVTIPSLTNSTTGTVSPVEKTSTYVQQQGVPPIGNLASSQMPITGNLVSSQVPTTGNLASSQVPTTGNLTSSQVPTTGNLASSQVSNNIVQITVDIEGTSVSNTLTSVAVIPASTAVVATASSRSPASPVGYDNAAYSTAAAEENIVPLSNNRGGNTEPNAHKPSENKDQSLKGSSTHKVHDNVAFVASTTDIAAAACSSQTAETQQIAKNIDIEKLDMPQVHKESKTERNLPKQS